jgi:flavin-binding protein dodecin
MPDKQTASKEPGTRENKTHNADVESKGDGHSNESLISDAVQLARSQPAQLAPRDVIALQRRIGNQGVAHIIQTKLKVGAVDDPFEREADQVAEQVLQTPEPARSTQSPLQRQEDEEEIQTKLVLRRQEEEEEI